jgi:hypothetical protein
MVSIARQKLYKSLIIANSTNSSPRHVFNRIVLPLSNQQVIRFAGLEPDPFGHQSERVLIRELGLQPRKAHDHDGILELTGHRIEIKCARYKISSGVRMVPDLKYKSRWDTSPMDLKYKSRWDTSPMDLKYKYKHKYKWTRINPLAGFDLLLLALLDWDGFVIQILDKQQVLDLAERIADNPLGKFVIRDKDLTVLDGNA